MALYILGLLWEDFKNDWKGWLSFLLWEVPTDIAWELFLTIREAVCPAQKN